MQQRLSQVAKLLYLAKRTQPEFFSGIILNNKSLETGHRWLSQKFLEFSSISMDQKI